MFTREIFFIFVATIQPIKQSGQISTIFATFFLPFSMISDCPIILYKISKGRTRKKGVVSIRVKKITKYFIP
jgi:hypothetical protein